MQTNRLMILVLAITLLCGVLCSRSPANQEATPAYCEHLPAWYKAVQMKKRLDANRFIDAKTKATLSQTFSRLQKEHALFFATTPPVFQDLSELRKQLAAHNKDAEIKGVRPPLFSGRSTQHPKMLAQRVRRRESMTAFNL